METNKPLNIPAPNTAPTAQQATMVATAQAAMDDNIVAAPLVEPDFMMKLRPKNPGVSLRWVLHGLEMNNGTVNTRRFAEAQAQGYRVATMNDLTNPPMTYAKDNGTKFINGDLILMLIDKRKYQGAILYREQQAVKQMQAVRSKGIAEVNKSLTGQPSETRAKISTFDPGLKDMEELDPELKEDNEGDDPFKRGSAL